MLGLVAAACPSRKARSSARTSKEVILWCVGWCLRTLGWTTVGRIRAGGVQQYTREKYLGGRMSERRVLRVGGGVSGNFVTCIRGCWRAMMMGARSCEAAPTRAARVWLSGFEGPHRAIARCNGPVAAEELIVMVSSDESAIPGREGWKSGGRIE